MRSQITIFEGPDGAGKSTLVKEYIEVRHGNTIRSIHHGPYTGVEEIAPTYFSSMLPAYLDRRSVVLDRAWISEPIYAYVYRENKSRITMAQARILTRVALSRQGVVVVCLPPLERCLENWRIRHAQGREYLSSEVYLTRVWELYREFVTLTDQRSSVVTFDYTTETIEDVLEKIDAARGKENLGPGVGAWRPGEVVLLIGDRPSTPKGETPSRWKFPFGSLRNQGCSRWFADQLFDAEILEGDLYWINAHDATGKPESAAFVDKLKPKATFALGLSAAAWCAENGVEAITVDHPQYWRRFHASEPYPLLKEISNALRR